MNRLSSGIVGIILIVRASAALAIRDADQSSPPPLPVRAAPQRALAADQHQVAIQAARDGVKVEWDERLGTPRSLRGQNLSARRAFSGEGGASVAVAGWLEYTNSLVYLNNTNYHWQVSNVPKPPPKEGI